MDITIKFVDFWNGFKPHDNFILNALKNVCNVTVLNDDHSEPDILFCSLSGSKHFNYENCIKVFFSGENDVPDFNLYDYAISSANIVFGQRHLRYPLYANYTAYRTIRSRESINISNRDLLNRDFCSIVISNNISNDPMRELIWQQLGKYRTIASGGRYNNNIGGPVADKMEFIANYKFNLALENSKCDYYTTEKIVEPMAACSVPIYWGNKYVDQEFNKEAFIDISDFSTVDNAVDFIRKIDTDDALYLKMIHAPKFAADATVDWHERLSDFLKKIVFDRERHVCRYGYTAKIISEYKLKNFLFQKRILRGVARKLLK